MANFFEVAVMELFPERPSDLCVQLYFEAQVARTPDATAVVFGDDKLTYAQLNLRANSVARRLLALGIGPEATVGVCMDRSLELAVAVLGLLKAGGVCVPLDPDYPRERLEYILDDARIGTILTQERALPWLPEARRTILRVCAEDQLDEHAALNPKSGVTDENLSTIFYTSGSTGTPKAVMVPHRVCCSRLLWSQTHGSPIGVGDRTVLCTSIGFGAFLGEFAWPLMTGATLVLAAPGSYQDVESMTRLLVDNGITLVCLVPSVLQFMLRRAEEGANNPFARLRHILSHGEALSVELQRRVVSRVPAILHKYYGLTECPGATYWNCTTGGASDALTIGRPTDTQVYILDDALRPVPQGEMGEIFLSGTALTRGYLNRPDLTAERYLPNPFNNLPGARMYRTGDRARWLSDGTIEFAGRVDHLVKIRGLRIELGEIETALRKHPGVHDAVVTAQTTGGSRVLVAHVVRDSGQDVSGDDLRAALERSLPPFLVPSIYDFREQLPRILNGKVDRRALGEYLRDGARTDRTNGTPRDALETELAGIWANVLEVERVGIHDDFFELGGHSLLVALVCERVGNAFGVTVALNTIFESPTVAQMADLIHRGALPRRDESSSSPPRPSLFCLARALELARHLGTQPVRSLDIEIEPREWIAMRSIEAYAGHFVSRILSIQPEGPYLLSGYSSMTLIAFEIARQLTSAGHEVAKVVLFEAVPIPLIRPNDRAWKRRTSPAIAAAATASTESNPLIAHRSSPLQRLASLRGRASIMLHWSMLHVPMLDRSLSIMPWLRTLKAGKSYAPAPYRGRVVIYTSSQTVERFGGAAYHECWTRLAGTDLRIEVFDGEHSCMFHGGHLDRMIEDLRHEVDGVADRIPAERLCAV
jgi:amino acid adenylation domain-containing protein